MLPVGEGGVELGFVVVDILGDFAEPCDDGLRLFAGEGIEDGSCLD